MNVTIFDKQYVLIKINDTEYFVDPEAFASGKPCEAKTFAQLLKEQ